MKRPRAPESAYILTPYASVVPASRVVPDDFSLWLAITRSADPGDRMTRVARGLGAHAIQVCGCRRIRQPGPPTGEPGGARRSWPSERLAYAAAAHSYRW